MLFNTPVSIQSIWPFFFCTDKVHMDVVAWQTASRSVCQPANSNSRSCAFPSFLLFCVLCNRMLPNAFPLLSFLKWWAVASKATPRRYFMHYSHTTQIQTGMHFLDRLSSLFFVGYVQRCICLHMHTHNHALPSPYKHSPFIPNPAREETGLAGSAVNWYIPRMHEWQRQRQR
jgi:hypothetical protein